MDADRAPQLKRGVMWLPLGIGDEHFRRIAGEWYESQCNEDWEHQFGVSIGTLDNPGWTVTIDLDGTDLAGEIFRTIEDLSPGRDWIKCWVESGKFNGVGGPQKLEEILTIFLRWAQKKKGE